MKKKFQNLGAQAERLDFFLASESGLPRSQISELIKANTVTINDIKVNKPSKLVNNQDIVEIDAMDDMPESGPLITEDIPVEIVYEDSDMLAINKPAGMVVHPGAGNKTGTLVNAIASKLANFVDNTRPGVVHRLDKATSGIILVSKNQRSLAYYSQQFADRNVTKKYLVVAHGDVQKLYGNKFAVNKNIARSKQNRQKMATYDIFGKEAVTEFEVIKIFRMDESTYTLLWAFPKTGRTHQIRVHLASIGHSILGDDKYGVKQPKFIRLMLHAHLLNLKSIEGEELTLKADIPNLFYKLSDATIN